MKRTRNLLALFVAICITPSLFSCADKASQSTNAEPLAEQSIKSDAYMAQIEYYSSLVTDLQEQLLNMKEENYIEKQEYILKIEELEKLIQLLNDRSSSIAVDGKLPEESSKAADDDDTVELSIKPKFEYSISNREIIITKYVGEETEVTIPTHIDGCPVVAIGEEAFKGSSVRSVTLPQSIRRIDWFAFAECFALTEITIPSSVTSIGYGAFELCSSSLLIICEKGSYVEAYAQSWGMRVSTIK